MHAPSFRPRLATRATRAAGLGLLLLVGCDWRTPARVPGDSGSYDLSDLASGTSDWRSPRKDLGKRPSLRIDTIGENLVLVVPADAGQASRWRRKVRWDAGSHPILTWTWGLDHGTDSAMFKRRRGPAATMAVDVTLASTFGFHKTIRYIWSARRDKGSVWANRDSWHPKVRVLRDVRDSVGTMVSERVDVWNDFQELWGYTPRHQSLAIAVSVQDPDAKHAIEGRFGAILAHPKENPLP